jgi:putative DNA primase/helicase
VTVRVEFTPSGPFRQHAPRLAGFGYAVIPISRHDDRSYRFPGKQPAQREGWSEGCPRDQWEQFAACGLGILTRTTPAIDIDVLEPEIAAAIQEQADRVLGNAPIRFGQAPKRLMPFQLQGDPFPKMKVLWKAGAGAELHPENKPPAVEILTAGQQFVALGVHPGTGKPYRWERDPDLTIPRTLLPFMDRDRAERFIKAVAAALKRIGADQLKVSGVRVPERKAQKRDRPETTTPTADGIRRYLERLGNDCDYDEWIKRGHAIKAALDNVEGQAIWEWWSSLSPKNDPQLTARKWATFKPRDVTAGSVFWGAR